MVDVVRRIMMQVRLRSSFLRVTPVSPKSVGMRMMPLPHGLPVPVLKAPACLVIVSFTLEG